MAFFPRSSLSPFVSEPSFTPLFRLLDDFDSYNRGPSGRTGHGHTAVKSFQPKFDVKEVEAGYELHGELPGIEQKDIEIEFTDSQTLSIRGHTERHYESGTRPAELEQGTSAPAALTEGGETQNKFHKATAEDDPEEPATPTTETSEVAKHQQQEVATKQQEEAPKSRYWVSERSIGEFSRTFSFPVRVDQDQVSATMKNGILSILVPKAKKQESRKITIA